MGSAKVQLRLLGSFAVTRGSEDVTAALSQPKRLALVAWLALTRPNGLHRRDTLCALLWPESSDEKARGALRQLLSVLRRELGDHAFVTQADLVGIDRSVVSSDAEAVFDALEAGNDATAVDLYAGELLPGLHLSGGESFERWFEQVRGELQRGVTRAGWRLTERAEAEGRPAEARRWAERAVAIDPDDEAGLRRLMTLQAQQGDRTAALRTYEPFARRLKEDWGTDPEAATLELVERIRTGGLNGRREARDTPAEPAGGPHLAEIRDAPAPPVASPNVEIPRARPRRRPWPWLIAAGAAGVAILLGSRAARTDSSLVAGRVLVVPFENHTGDPRLDAMGMVAADWIIQGLQRSGLAQVVDPGTALLTTQGVPDRTPQTMSALRQLARGTRAGFLIVGAVAKVRDSVEYSARLADTRSGRLLRVLDPIRAPMDDPTSALDELRSRFAGAIATETDIPLIPLSRGDRPPRLEAYQEFVAGLEPFSVEHYNEAISRFRRAVALDSSFTLAMMWLSYAFFNGGMPDSADAIVNLISERRDGLSPLAQAWVEAMTLERRLLDSPNSYPLTEAVDQVIAARRRVVRLSPASENEWKLAHKLLYYGGRPREAIEILERLDLDRNWITRWGAYWDVLIEAWHHVGDYRAALAAARKGRRLHPELNLLPYEIETLAAMGEVAAVQADIDTLLQLKDPPIYTAVLAAAHELEAHGHPAAAIQLLEWGDPWIRERLANDTTTETRLALGIVHAYLATYRGDRQLAAEARAILEPALFMPESLMKGNARLLGYLTAVCTEGDSARIARLPEPLPPPLMPVEEAGIAVCKGDREGAIRVLQKQNGVWYAHVLPTLRPLRQDPRFQKWLRPKG